MALRLVLFFSIAVSHAARSLDQVVETPLGAANQIGRLTNLMQLTVDMG